MQQQSQKKARQVQDQANKTQRRPFPLARVIVAFFFILLLGLLIVGALVATGHDINLWVLIASAVSSLIVATIPILQWLFPLNPVTWQSGSTPSSPDSSPIQQSSPVLAAVPSQTSPGQSSHIITASSSLLVLPARVSTDSFFHFNETQLSDPGEFYGRMYERMTLITRTGKRNSTAIIGDYRAGKSWLMQYLQQIAPTHPQLGPNVRIGRLSATNPQCQTLGGFVKRALEVLNVPLHQSNSRQSPLERLTLAARDLQTLGIIPVLCIDEFAGMIGRPGFDKNFVAGLRAIATDEGLVLITASREPLHKVIEHLTGEDSPLFNIMPEILLKPFTKSEAEMFISEKSQQAGLNQDEQAFFLECAVIYQSDGTKSWPPLRLQLVGQMFLTEKDLAAAGQDMYDFQDLFYRANFQKRLDEQYKAVVRIL